MSVMKATVDKLQPLAQELTRLERKAGHAKKEYRKNVQKDIKIVKAKIGGIENEARTTALELRRTVQWERYFRAFGLWALMLRSVVRLYDCNGERDDHGESHDFIPGPGRRFLSHQKKEAVSLGADHRDRLSRL